MDKALLVWRPDTDTGIWMEDSRLGEVGGNTQGFYGGMFGPRGETILAHSFHGAFYLWARKSLSLEGGAPEEVHTGGRHTWVPRVCISGHFAGVLDLAWDPSGSYLLSVSDDQVCLLCHIIPLTQLLTFDVHLAALLGASFFADNKGVFALECAQHVA